MISFVLADTIVGTVSLGLGLVGVFPDQPESL